MCEIKNMAKRCGQKNPPGTKALLHFIPEGEVVSTPPLIGGTAAGDTKRLSGAFSLSTTSGEGYFRTIPIIMNTGQVTYTMVGEEGSRSFENGVAFMVAGQEADRLEFAECVANACLIAVIQERADEEPFIFGRVGDPAYIKEINGDSGLKSGDRRGTAYVLGDGTGEVPSKLTTSVTLNTTPAP